MSLRARIAWIVALTVAVLLVALGATVQVQSARALVAAVDDDLRAIARSIERDPRGFLVLSAPGRDRFGGAAGVVQLVGADGQVARERRPRVPADPERVRLPVDDTVLAVARGEAPEALLTVTVEDVPLRMLVVPVGEARDGGFALQVARPIDEVEDVIGVLRRRTALFTLLGASLAAAVAWAVAGRSIRPVSELTDAVEGVRDGRDLARRVPVPDGDDEVARLARAFDAMLGRLADSRLAQDRLAADASHELRTPLTSLRTNIEVLAADAERLAPADRAQLTEDVIGQLEELTAMVDGLVTLTRIDTDATTRGDIDVVRVAQDVMAAARRRYPERADDLTLDADAARTTVDGDGRELTLAVSALVDNAVKYAPDGPIALRISDGDGGGSVRIAVTDRGPGVDAAALPHLFERFFRAPEARSRPGAGLGLALVERVASAHGGVVRAALAAPHGLSVTIELPVRRGGH
jgi:two-component system sensor histidine kinase MprB